jgi:squalene synthase HpnC
VSESLELAGADAFCRRLLRGRYENFWVSSPFLPRAIRPHIARLYAFCRVTDDLGDECGDHAEERLSAWRQDLERCFDPRARPLHPVLLAVAHTVREYRLPEQPFFDLVAANVQDQRLKEYTSWEELVGYCRLSAAPVGRLVLSLFGLASPPLERLSDDVCIGLQLVNHAQDVSVDRGKGRRYVPWSDIEALGFEGAVRSMCARAATLLDSGRALEAAVVRGLRIQLALYRLGGVAVLDAIRRLDFRTDLRRPSISNRVKLGLLSRALLQAGWRRTHARRHRAA